MLEQGRVGNQELRSQDNRNIFMTIFMSMTLMKTTEQTTQHIYYSVKTKFRGCVQKLFSVPNYSKVSSDSLGHLFPQ